MKCPFCGHLDNKVVDSRVSKDASVIRRRRQCLDCGKRFTTYERVEEMETFVIKKDGSRQPYDRLKVAKGMLQALNKRPVSVEEVDAFIAGLEQKFSENNRREIPAREIGEAVMNWLRDKDDVAFVRFASVYREFRDVKEFMRELRQLMNSRAEPLPTGDEGPSGD